MDFLLVSTNGKRRSKQRRAVQVHKSEQARGKEESRKQDEDVSYSILTKERTAPHKDPLHLGQSTILLLVKWIMNGHWRYHLRAPLGPRSARSNAFPDVFRRRLREH